MCIYENVSFHSEAQFTSQGFKILCQDLFDFPPGGYFAERVRRAGLLVSLHLGIIIMHQMLSSAQGGFSDVFSDVFQCTLMDLKATLQII